MLQVAGGLQRLLRRAGRPPASTTTSFMPCGVQTSTQLPPPRWKLSACDTVGSTASAHQAATASQVKEQS